MDNSEISVTQALNHLQSWLNAGEYEKVIQGSQEILEIEPGNQRALALFRQAEERRHAAQTGPTPAPQPEPEPAPQPPQDPLAELQVETPPAPAPHTSPEPPMHHFDRSERRKLFLAILIPALLVVVFGSIIVWRMSDEQREETIEESLTYESTEDISYLAANDERVETITAIAEVLDKYYEDNGSYPSTSQIESILVSDEAFDSVPVDPSQGSFGKAGKAFGYVYAVYDTSEGENAEYIVSALFEDSQGFGYAWSQGASTATHSDFRDTDEAHITFLGSEDSFSESTTQESENSSSGGPKVRP